MTRGITTFLAFCLAVLLIQTIEASNLASNTLEIPETRILNGSVVSIYNARYIVSVRLKALEASQGYGYGHICTGAVISQRMVLTGAVCTLNSNSCQNLNYTTKDFTLVMGSMYLYQKDLYTLQYNVQEIVVFPKFSYPNSSLYDMAAMFIDGYIPRDWPTVSPVSLNPDVQLENDECFATGWGKPPSDIENVDGLLVQVEVPIMNDAACEDYFYTFTPAMFCAGYNNFSGVNSCDGDSGVPLTCQGLLTGIAAWFNGCLNVPYRGFYGNVSYFHNWILATNASFNYSYYENNSIKTKESLFLLCLCFLLVGKFVGRFTI